MNIKLILRNRYLYRGILSVFLILFSVSSIVQATSAVLEETVKVAGTSFSVGETTGGGDEEPANTALKILADSSASATDSNLVDSVDGPAFEGITQEWSDQFAVKVYNKGANAMDLVSKVDYVSDPDVLRDDLYVEVLEWNDTNNNGIVDTGETGTSYGYDTILRMRNDTFALGSINPNETRGFVMKFDGTGVSDSNDGQQAVYDFLITGTETSE